MKAPPALTRSPSVLHIATGLVTLESRPPLEDIAELNLKQYQVQSDVDNQLHISAVPMLAFFGFPSAAEEVSAGPGEAIAFPSEGRAEYIEPRGTSFDYQFRRLEQIASQINELGLSAVLGQKLSAETAEAKRIDRSQGDSNDDGHCAERARHDRQLFAVSCAVPRRRCVSR
jgi:hypothetical protein